MGVHWIQGSGVKIRVFGVRVDSRVFAAQG